MPKGYIPNEFTHSDLERRNWTHKELCLNPSPSFWTPYKGLDCHSIIYQKNDMTCTDGITSVFDFDGFLTGSSVRGAGEACDVEYEDKRKFSGIISAEMQSFYVNNGNRFSGCIIGDLNLPQHKHSIKLLKPLQQNQKDQAIFDHVSGAVVDENPTHVIVMDKLDYEAIEVTIPTAVKSGIGMHPTLSNGLPDKSKFADKRRALTGYRLENGTPMYLALFDFYALQKLKNDDKYVNIKINGDVRGANNAVLSGVVGKQGQFYYVESPLFMGATKAGMFRHMEHTEIEGAGLRRYATDGVTSIVWEGQPLFDGMEAIAREEVAIIQEAINSGATDAEIQALEDGREAFIYSRGAILGAGAVMELNGQKPRYDVEWSNFKKSSKSMLEIFYNTKRVMLMLELGKQYKHKVNDISFGIINVDVKVI